MPIPEVHFSCFASVELDADIILPCLRHYLQFGFSSYSVCLHYTSQPALASTVREELEYLSDRINVEKSTEPFDTSIRSAWHRKKVRELNPRDIMVVADVDEFHVYPVKNDRVCDWMRKYDFIQGTLLDRWGSRLCPVRENVFEQYPYSGNLGVELRSGLNTHQRCLSKIMAHRSEVPVGHGHHLAKPEGLYICYGGLEVHHFCYRSNTMERLRKRPYVSSVEMQRVADYFMCSDKYGYLIAQKEKEERNAQQSKGWVPARSRA